MKWGQLTAKKTYEFFQGPLESQTLGDFLDHKFQNSRWLIDFGAIYVNGKRATHADLEISSKDVVRAHFDPKRYPLDRKDLRRRVISETENYIIVNKPSGLPMHPTLDNLSENLISGFDEKLFVTHRLDVPTSGLVLIAKTKEYQTAFNNLLLKREVKKIYRANVAGEISLGQHIHFMKKTVTAPKVVMGEKPEEGDWQECRLFIHSNVERRLVVELLTGRTHQIRAQLAFERAPILGDEMYGGPESDFFGLSATLLSFKCPVTGHQQTFELTSP